MEEREENSKGYVKCLESGYRYFKEQYLFSLTSDFKDYLVNNYKITEDLKKKIKENGYILSNKAKISLIDNNEWTIKDEKKEYKIRRSLNHLYIYKRRDKEEKNTIVEYFVFKFPKINYSAMGITIGIPIFVVLINIFLMKNYTLLLLTIIIIITSIIVFFWRYLSALEKMHNYYYEYLNFEVKSI